MISNRELEAFALQWKDVSVIRASDSQFGFPAYIVILIFDQKAHGHEFLKFLAKHDFGLGAHNNDGTYLFEIGFPKDDTGLSRPTDTPIGHYQLSQWFRDRNRFLLTAGIWMISDQNVRLSDYSGSGFLPVDKLYFEKGL